MKGSVHIAKPADMLLCAALPHPQAIVLCDLCGLVSARGPDARFFFSFFFFSPRPFVAPVAPPRSARTEEEETSTFLLSVFLFACLLACFVRTRCRCSCCCCCCCSSPSNRHRLYVTLRVSPLVPSRPQRYISPVYAPRERI